MSVAPGDYNDASKNGQTVIIIQQGAVQPKEIRNNSVLACGALNLIFGIVVLIINIAEIAAFNNNGSFTGMWGGLFLIIAGGLGVGAGAKSCGCGPGVVTGALVMSILASIISAVAVIVAGIGAGAITLLIALGGENLEAVYATSVVRVALFLLGFIVSIIEASFCCSCCYRPVNQVA